MGEAVGLLLLLTHRHPSVGDDDIRSTDRGNRVGKQTNRAVVGGGNAFGVGDDGRQRGVFGGRGNAHVHTGGRPGQQVGLRHVARAVTEKGDGEPG